MTGELCPYQIRWGSQDGEITRCTRPVHVHAIEIVHNRDGKYGTNVVGDSRHIGPTGLFPGQVVAWFAGDRREYIGEWPGYCPREDCGFPASHHGNHGI